MSFHDVPDGSWVDPPLTDQFVYSFGPEEADSARFTRIVFPTGFEDTFSVWVDGVRVASGLGPADDFVFSGEGVKSFTIKGIDPLGDSGTVDAALSDAFPLQVFTNQEYSDIVMTVPEPGMLALLGTTALGLLGYAWRRRKRTA
jgi:hypothetical protein